MLVLLILLVTFVSVSGVVKSMSALKSGLGKEATNKASSVQLPERLLVGYANWNECAK